MVHDSSYGTVALHHTHANHGSPPHRSRSRLRRLPAKRQPSNVAGSIVKVEIQLTGSCRGELKLRQPLQQSLLCPQVNQLQASLSHPRPRPWSNADVTSRGLHPPPRRALQMKLQTSSLIHLCSRSLAAAWRSTCGKQSRSSTSRAPRTSSTPSQSTVVAATCSSCAARRTRCGEGHLTLAAWL